MNRRRKSRLPFAAYAALIFNASLCITPFIAARAISTAYGDKKPAFEATPEALSATRTAIDERFQAITREREGAPREVWANLVRDRLEAEDMTSVDGLLLGAPAMLDGKEGDALRERIKVADQAGDKAVLAAALTYLPDDVQDEYERRTAPLMAIFNNSAPVSSVPGAGKAPDATTPEAAKPAAPAARDDDRHIEFHMLGDMRDLALQASLLNRRSNVDDFAFILSGVGLILAEPAAQEGASIALSARRGKKIEPAFLQYLENKLYAAAPKDEIKRVLAGEFQNEFGASVTGPAVVERVFKSTVNREALESFLGDLRILRDIARDTSPQAAVAIISRVKDGVDLRRAALVVRAGGNRAVTLEHFDGDHLLDSARTTINWTNQLKMQVAGLLACLALLGFLAVTVCWKSVRRGQPKKVSAVYLMDEYSPS